MASAGRRRISALLGLGYVAGAVAIVVMSILVYDKAFTDEVSVTLRTDSVGNALQKGSDVKLRGVPVGRVAGVRAVGDGARIDLQLTPDLASEIPASTTARLLPKTLFGERYVSLVLPSDRIDRSGQGALRNGLRDGDTIDQDKSAAARDLEDLFDQLLPLLTAVQPEKISATLSEIATALRGQGGDLGDTLRLAESYLGKLDPQVPQLADDLARLGTVARQYDDAVPDLLAALDNLTVTSRTLVDQRQELSDTFATVAAGANTTTGFLVPNEDTIVIVSKEGRRALAAVAPYASTFPCTFKALTEFIPKMDKVLGKGTDQPGLHARIRVIDAPTPYRPGKDAVTYRAGVPGCPYFPGSGTSTSPAARGSLVTAGTTARRTGTTAHAGEPGLLRSQTAAADGLGKANSPAENQLIAELVAPDMGMDPEAFPRWGSLLLGPTLRGRTVEVS